MHFYLELSSFSILRNIFKKCVFKPLLEPQITPAKPEIADGQSQAIRSARWRKWVTLSEMGRMDCPGGLSL